MMPLAKDRNLQLSQQINQTVIGVLTKAIIDIQDDDLHLQKLYAVYDLEYTPKPIKIYIDCYGGETYACFGLIGIMNSSITPIYTIVTGCAMSAGFLIAINGYKRYAHKSSTYMYHQVSNCCCGEAKDIEDNLFQIKRMQQMMEDNIVNKTLIPRKRLKEVYDTKTDWYMSASEAVELGVVDQII